jgi:hypothetical protein
LSFFLGWLYYSGVKIKSSTRNYEIALQKINSNKQDTQNPGKAVFGGKLFGDQIFVPCIPKKKQQNFREQLNNC